VDAEIMEFEVKESSKINKKKIRDLDFPKTAIIGGVVRKVLAILLLEILNFDLKIELSF
jgi:trk system potassium uptake protein TrkA